METQDQFRKWLRQQLEARGHGSKAGRPGASACRLGLPPDAVTRMIALDPNKEGRAIKADELMKIRQFFGADEAQPGIRTVRVAAWHRPRDRQSVAQRMLRIVAFHRLCRRRPIQRRGRVDAISFLKLADR